MNRIWLHTHKLIRLEPYGQNRGPSGEQKKLLFY